MTSTRRADLRTIPALRPPRGAILPPESEGGTAQLLATRAAQRLWRLEALACLRRKSR